MGVFVPGLRLSGRYVLARRIGAGGISQVWLAEDELLGRPVAIKGIDHAFVGDLPALIAIRREARAAASVCHPHVAQIYDYGEAETSSGGPVPYLVMELLDGPDLSQRLKAGPLPWPDAVRMATQIARALAAAHAAGVVHRDIKPGNIVLTASGARVVDFGLAAVRPDDDGRPGGYVDDFADDDADELRGGTPAFVAPEVIADDEATSAADVYGFGAVLFAALTGGPPIAITSWAQARQAHAEGRQPVPLVVDGLPPAVADLCTRCLAAAPQSRPTAAQIADELSPLVRPRPLAARPAATVANGQGRVPALMVAATVRRAPPALRPDSWRRPLAVAASALIVAGLLLMAVAAFGGPRRVPSASAMAPVPSAPATPVEGAPGNQPPTDAAASPSAAPASSGPQAATPADALGAVRLEIAAARAAGIIDQRTAVKLARELDKLVADGKSLPRRVENVRRDLTRSLARSDVPQPLVNRLDGLLRQVGGGFTVTPPIS